MKILLGHLGSNGDCLYATTVARQIKIDYPKCHLTWAISSLARRVIDNNPDVDDVWEIPLTQWEDMSSAWWEFRTEALFRHSRGEFDRIFLTQISPDNFRNYDGTIRPSIFRGYPHPITAPVESIIVLTEEETEKVDGWLRRSNVSHADKIVLFECSSKSGQSFVTPQLAIEAARHARCRDPGLGFILSSHCVIDSGDPLIVSGADLSLRETVRLTHKANLFVGCGSGVTAVATSAAAKPDLPNIQWLDASTSVYGSFCHDFSYFGKKTDHFIEMTTPDPVVIADAIVSSIRDGVETARSRFGENIEIQFSLYRKFIDLFALRKGRYLDAANSLRLTAERYGWTDELLDFAEKFVSPLLRYDLLYRHRHRAAELQAYHDSLAAAQSARVRQTSSSIQHLCKNIPQNLADA
jgi:hypothetical protein